MHAHPPQALLLLLLLLLQGMNGRHPSSCTYLYEQL
jgi:hypothetical protein